MAFNPPDYGGYERQRAQVNRSFGEQAANNAYARFISQQRGERGLGDMSRNFGRQMPRFQASWGQRGLSGPGVRSGTRQQGTNQFVGDYARSYGRAQQDLTQQLQQYDMTQKNLEAWRNQSLRDIDAQKAQDIANAASNMKYIESVIGGL